MHEESLIRDLIRQVVAIRSEHQFRQVRKIAVEIGPLCGVEKLLLESAFKRIWPELMQEGEPRLEIVEIPIQARCLSCGSEFEMEELNFCCVSCNERRVEVLRGDCVRLLHVDLTVDAEATSEKLLEAELLQGSSMESTTEESLR